MIFTTLSTLKLLTRLPLEESLINGDLGMTLSRLNPLKNWNYNLSVFLLSFIYQLQDKLWTISKETASLIRRYSLKCSCFWPEVCQELVMWSFLMMNFMLSLCWVKSSVGFALGSCWFWFKFHLAYCYFTSFNPQITIVQDKPCLKIQNKFELGDT